MMNFCTSYGANYIHKGLVLYESLRKVESDFTMYVMAFDKECYDYLKKLNLPQMVVDNFDDIETDELRKIKKERTRSEYCWTVGPLLTEHFIVKYNLESVAFIDADMMFYTSPKVIFDEIGDNSIAITLHDMDRVIDQSKYIVQFEFFRNDENGMKCLRWWRDRCIEWCYCRYEDGKYGDQGYLEQFDKLFDKVYVLKNPAACVSIVNIGTLFPVGKNMSYRGKEYPIVIFHYLCSKFDVKDDKTLDLVEIGGKVDENWLSFYHDYCNAMIEVYNKYLGKNLTSYKIHEWTPLRVAYQKLKSRLRKNAVAQWFYYKLLNAKQPVKESNQI